MIQCYKITLVLYLIFVYHFILKENIKNIQNVKRKIKIQETECEIFPKLSMSYWFDNNDMKFIVYM